MKNVIITIIVFFAISGCAKERSPEEWLELGRKAAKEDNEKLAVEHFSKAIETNPDYAIAYFERAKYPQNEKQKEDLEKYIDITSGNLAEAYLGMAIFLRIERKYDEAIKNVDKALLLKKDYDQAYKIKLEILKASGDKTAAADLYESLPDSIRKDIDDSGMLKEPVKKLHANN